MSSIRERFERIIEKAAEAGFPDAEGLMRLTPREMEWALKSFAARRRQALELMDAAAWLAGRYAAIAINAPGKYPSAPDGVNADLPDSEMTDAEIRGAFERLARKGGSE